MQGALPQAFLTRFVPTRQMTRHNVLDFRLLDATGDLPVLLLHVD